MTPNTFWRTKNALHFFLRFNIAVKLQREEQEEVTEEDEMQDFFKFVY